jgi:hypothetical protein
MARKSNAQSLTARIESLLEDRAKHESAIGTIDATLDRIHSALGGNMSFEGPAKTAKPGGKKRGPKGRRKRGKFAMKAEDSVLDFVKSQNLPTTRDVNQHWKADGRGGSADNALTKLVQEKKLKRIAVKGERGSKYSVL